MHSIKVWRSCRLAANVTICSNCKIKSYLCTNVFVCQQQTIVSLVWRAILPFMTEQTIVVGLDLLCIFVSKAHRPIKKKLHTVGCKHQQCSTHTHTHTVSLCDDIKRKNQGRWHFHGKILNLRSSDNGFLSASYHSSSSFCFCLSFSAPRHHSITHIHNSVHIRETESTF